MNELDAVKQFAKEMGIAPQELIYPVLDTKVRRAGGIEFIENIGEIPTIMIEDAFDPESPYLKGYRTQFYGWGDGRVVFRPNELTVWTGYNGHGKALDIETPIPTSEGWKKMRNVHVGDVLFDENGRRCMVTQETPIQYERKCFELIFSDGTKIIADADHRWLTKTAKCRASERTARRNNRFGTRAPLLHGTDQSSKRTYAAIVNTQQIHDTLYVKNGCYSGRAEHSIDVAKALQTSPKDLPIDPYLLGVWLGDGTSCEAGLTCADDGIVQELKKTGFKLTKRKSKYGYGICGGLTPLLKSNNLINNKHIPEIYLRGSYDQRLGLVQGLMDTDGYTTNYGRCEFTSIKIHLAKKFLELILSLGVQAKLITGDATLYGKICSKKYRVTFTPDFPVFRLPRKAKYVKNKISNRAKVRFIVGCQEVPSVPVKCIAVNSPSHLYLASDSLVPTHNTQFVNQLALEMIANGAKVCIASLEMSKRILIRRLFKQASGLAVPAPGYLHAIRQHYSHKLFLFDHLGAIGQRKLLNAFKEVLEVYGVDVFIIDSLMKCGILEDDYNAQKLFIDMLCDFKFAHRCHIHLIAHPRKGIHENEAPGKMDIKGTGTITDLADNAFAVWRNKPKEAYLANNPHDEETKKKPDTIVYCNKQRNGDWEGQIHLWYHRGCYQFLQSYGAKPNEYVKYDHRQDTLDYLRSIPNL